MKNAQKYRHNPRNPERGAAAVEFALVLPVFCLLLFGGIDFIWYMGQHGSVVNAVDEGVREGVTLSQTGSPDPAAKAVEVATARIQAAGISMTYVTLTTSYTGTAPTKLLVMQATMTMKGLTGFAPYIPKSTTYKATARLERQ